MATALMLMAEIGRLLLAVMIGGAGYGTSLPSLRSPDQSSLTDVREPSRSRPAPPGRTGGSNAALDYPGNSHGPQSGEGFIPAFLVGHDKDRGSSDDPSAAPNGGTARYVSPSGKDIGSCANGLSPCATLSYAMGQSSAGDSIFLRGGSYAHPVVWNKSGTASHPMEVRSYPGEWAVFNGYFLVSGANYVQFRNFEVTGSDRDGVYISYSQAGVLFENIYSHNNNASGFGHFESNKVIYRYCTSKENYDRATKGSNSDGFAISSGDNNTIEYCLSIHNSDDGFDLWKSTNSTLKYNVAYRNGWASGDGTGFKLGGGTNGGTHTIIGNIAHSSKNRGFDNNSGTGHRNFHYNIAYNNNAGSTRSGNWQVATGTATGRYNLSLGTGADLDDFSAMKSKGDNFGGGFGGTVDTTCFESVEFSNLKSTVVGSRYFHPTPALIDRGAPADPGAVRCPMLFPATMRNEKPGHS